MPKQLTEVQKAARLTITKEHLGHFHHDESKFLNCIVIRDEMWVYYAEPETNAQSKRWKRTGSTTEGFFLSSVKYRVVKVEYQVKTVVSS